MNIKTFKFPVFQKWIETGSASDTIGEYVAQIKIAKKEKIFEKEVILVSGLFCPINSANNCENAIYEHCFTYPSTGANMLEVAEMYDKTISIINQKFVKHIKSRYIEESE
jgi:hypothetical protein